LSLGLLVGAAVAMGCVGGDPTVSQDGQNLFERNCPHRALDAVLECDTPGYGELRFRRHVGQYVLEERSVEEDMTGSKELRCEYGPDPDGSWQTDYLLEGQQWTVTSVDELEQLVRALPDLDDEALETVLPSLDEPMALIRYHLGFFGRGEVTYEGLSTGLESFRPSDSDDNPVAAKTNFVIDETSYGAGFGGTYATGTTCRVMLEPVE
jgi:hypothetical protein